MKIKDKALKAYKQEIKRQEEEEAQKQKEKDARNAKQLREGLKRYLNIDVKPESAEIEIDGIIFYLGIKKLSYGGVEYHLGAKYKNRRIKVKGWSDVGALLDGRSDEPEVPKRVFYCPFHEGRPCMGEECALWHGACSFYRTADGVQFLAEGKA